MIASWLIGAVNPDWEEMEGLFEDIRTAAVYTGPDGSVEMVKVSEFKDINNPYKVLLHPNSLRKLRVAFLKFGDYVMFPTFYREVVDRLTHPRDWWALSYYDGLTFLGAWIGYICEGTKCREAQRLHLKVDPSTPPKEAVIRHLTIYNRGKSRPMA